MSIGTTGMSMIMPNGSRKSYGVSKRLKRRLLPLLCMSRGFSACTRFEFHSPVSLMSRGFQPSKPAVGVAPATGSNAIPASASGGPSQPSGGPSNGYITALAAATVLHSDDENLNPDVALRRKEKEEKKRRKAEKKAAKEEKKRIGEEIRERRAMESVGCDREREREGLHERKSRRDDRRGWDRGDDNR